MEIDYPLHLDPRGRTAAADEPDHVRDLIEQVLFTAPGERVNRPDFGTGLLQLVFAPNGDELATATQFLVQGALQKWLGDVIELQGVDVSAQDSALVVTVRYAIRASGERRTDTFVR